MIISQNLIVRQVLIKLVKIYIVIYIFTKVANFSRTIKNWENNKRFYLVWLRQTKYDGFFGWWGSGVENQKNDFKISF